MELSINTRNYGQQVFFMSDNGGYIFLEQPGRPGTMGKQICQGGKYTGGTLSATPETFERVCRTWHRAHMQEIKSYGGDY